MYEKQLVDTDRFLRVHGVHKHAEAKINNSLMQGIGPPRYFHSSLARGHLDALELCLQIIATGRDNNAPRAAQTNDCSV